MDFKKITVEEWIERVLIAIGELPVDDPYLSTKKGRTAAVNELNQFKKGLAKLKKRCSFIAHDHWNEFDVLQDRASRYIEFFGSMNGSKQKRQGRKPLPRVLLELFALGFEYSKGRKADMEKIIAAFSQPDSKSDDPARGVFVTKFSDATKNRSYLVGALPSVPAKLSDFSWIAKQKDRCFNNLIKIYKRSKNARFHQGSFLELKKDQTKKQQASSILNFLKSKYGFDGFI